jgi:hypothetical protein
MKNILIISLLALCGLVISSCSKDEPCMDETNKDCPNYDPCYGVQPIEAKIEIGKDNYQGPTSPSIRFEGDTVIHGSYVYLKTNIEDALNYKWTIGTDTRIREEQEFGLGFSFDDSTFLRHNPILITLVIEYASNECFPNQSLGDTLTKHLHFRGEWESAIFGTWEGTLDGDANNPYQLRFDWATNIPVGSLDSNIYVYNLYGEGEDCFHWSMSRVHILGYRNYIDFDQNRSKNWEDCGAPYYRWTRQFKTVVNTTNETIQIDWMEWKYKDNGDCCDTIPHVFRGHRLD